MSYDLLRGYREELMRALMAQWVGLRGLAGRPIPSLAG
jgi:hypothetical protein